MRKPFASSQIFQKRTITNVGMPPRSAGRRKARSLASDEPTEAPSTRFVKDAAPLWGAEDVTIRLLHDGMAKANLKAVLMAVIF